MPTATGLTQVDSVRRTIRTSINSAIARVQSVTGSKLETLTGRSSITAAPPAKVSRPGFGLVIGQVVDAPFMSNRPSGPAAGTFRGGNPARTFAVKM